MIALILGLFILFLTYAAGNQVLRIFKLPTQAGETLVLSLGLGLGLLSYMVFLLGIFAFLKPIFLGALLGVLSMLAILRGYVRPFSLQLFSLKYLDKSDIVFFILASVSLLASFAGVLSPETANDSLCYHLHLPKIFLAEGRIFSVPYEINSAFPFLMEMLGTLGLGIQGVALAKLLHFFMGILLALTTVTFLSPDFSSKHGRWTAYLLLTTPGILNQLGNTYVDVGLTCFVSLALLTVIRWMASGNNRWLLLCGIFIGFALSVKFLALIAALGLGVIVTAKTLKDSGKITLAFRSLMFFSIPALLFSFVWYLRSWMTWGNPVYPFFYSVFRVGDPTIHYDDIGVSKTLLSFFTVPWTLTMKPKVFEGFGDQLGPTYLAFLPFAFLSGTKTGKGWVGLWAGFYFVLWFFMGQSMRFLFPVLPALVYFIAQGFEKADTGRWKFPGIRILVLSVLVIHTGLGLYHYRKEIKVAVGNESADQYLMTNERSYGIASWSNQNLPPKSKILAADETHLYYFNHSIAREIAYVQAPEKKSYPPTSFEEAVTALKKDGFTHLLWTQNRQESNPDPWLASRSITRHLSAPQNEIALYLNPLYTTRFKQGDSEIVYQLYQLK